jgi:hypothetical protein
VCEVYVRNISVSSRSASGFMVVVSMRDPVTYCRVFFVVISSVAAAVLTGFAAMHVSLAEYADWGEVNMYDNLNESCTDKTM